MKNDKVAGASSLTNRRERNGIETSAKAFYVDRFWFGRTNPFAQGLYQAI